MKEVIERCNWLVNKCNDKAITPDVKDDFRYLLEEIQRLKEEYVILQNASDEVEEKKDREIERLTENNLSMQGEMARTWKKAEEKDKEIERLNKDLKDACEVIERLKEDKKKAIKYIEGNLENTSQTLRFDENKSYNTALLELKEILDKAESDEE